jgi:hypothetical protein
MQTINALTLTPNVNDWLGTSKHLRILHLFDRACNLINERGEILSVVTPQIGNGPFNLVLETDVCFAEHLRQESEVFIFPAQLYLGGLIIHLARVRNWNPRPDWKNLYNRKADMGRRLTQLPITNDLNSTGFELHSKNPSGLLEQHGMRNTQSLISNLSSALANADIPKAKEITSRLAGLGPGLTPSGDDYLMGALYAAWIIHPFTVASVLAHEIADTAAPLTTSLSAAWLRAAGKGEAGILWHDFFDALISTNAPQMQETMKKILAIGETSGTDALAGFAGVFTSLREQTGAAHG